MDYGSGKHSTLMDEIKCQSTPVRRESHALIEQSTTAAGKKGIFPVSLRFRTAFGFSCAETGLALHATKQNLLGQQQSRCATLQPRLAICGTSHSRERKTQCTGTAAQQV